MLGAGAILVACGGTSPATSGQTALQRLKSQGYARVGFANEAPFDYATSDGKLTGSEPETARVILKKLGIGQIDGVLTEFGSLIPGLIANRFDFVAAGMFINPTRCKQVAFSNPTFGIGEAMMVRKGNPLNLHSYADAANPKVRFGVVAGGVETGYATAAGVQQSQMVTFPDGPSALAGLQAGRIDAFTLSPVSLQSLLDRAKDPNLEAAQPWNDPVVNGKSVKGYGGFTFRQQDTDLIDAFNTQLAAIVQDGTWATTVKPFSLTSAVLPPAGVTAATLCAG
jgi:polar amino acid transport system substrate-binding protein